MPPKILSVEELERNQLRNQQMQQKPDPNMKPTRPNTQQQQPFTQQLAQQTKGQPMFMPHTNVPNDLQKNTNQRIPLGFPVNMMPPPPHLNVQTSQMHQNLTRMPLTNFNVCFFYRFLYVLLLKRSILISSDSFFSLFVYR